MGAYDGAVVCELIGIYMSFGKRHIKTSPMICRASQWTDFYMIVTSVMKE